MDFCADPGTISNHGGTVGHVQGMVNDAAAAANGVNLGVDTFGLINHFFAAGAREQADKAKESLAALIEGLNSVTTALRGCADTYSATDTGNAEGLRGIYS
jgi:hypothetical protein